MTQDTEIGRILMPGPTYLGMWARDTGVATLGLNRLGMTDLSGELLRRYWSVQITDNSDLTQFVFRNKGRASWTVADSFTPTETQLRAESGAFPTCVYIRTPEFPPGTREVYTDRADPDGTLWLIIALADYARHGGDRTTLHALSSQVVQAVRYLASRDVDHDHLLEQGPNEDWADTLLRRGKVSYTQALWYRCLRSAEYIFAETGQDDCRSWCARERPLVRAAINRALITRHGFYANFADGDYTSLHRSLDTALLVAFGVPPKEQARPLLSRLDGLEGPFGPAVVEPGVAVADMGPSKYPPGQYQNEGIWPWIASYHALAWACLGNRKRAREIILKVLPPALDTVHEWIDNLSGEHHHPNFATGAGALAWAITEGGL